MKEIFKNFGAYSSLITAAVLTLSIAYDLGYMMPIDRNLFNIMSLNNLLMHGISYIPPILGAFLIGNLIALFLISEDKQTPSERIERIKNTSFFKLFSPAIFFVLFIIIACAIDIFFGRFEQITLLTLLLAIPLSLTLLFVKDRYLKDHSEAFKKTFYWTGYLAVLLLVTFFVRGYSESYKAIYSKPNAVISLTNGKEVRIYLMRHFDSKILYSLDNKVGLISDSDIKKISYIYDYSIDKNKSIACKKFNYCRFDKIIK